MLRFTSDEEHVTSRPRNNQSLAIKIAALLIVMARCTMTQRP